ncbi:MAG: hypothetical protein ABFC88_13185 [Thermoguttaceae bacterium]
MSNTPDLQNLLVDTYVAFAHAAQECPVGPLVNATDALADALTQYGIVPESIDITE